MDKTIFCTKGCWYSEKMLASFGAIGVKPGIIGLDTIKPLQEPHEKKGEQLPEQSFLSDECLPGSSFIAHLE